MEKQLLAKEILEAEKPSEIGKKFEEHCHELLCKLAKIDGNTVEITGTKRGSVEGNLLKGDFVLNLKKYGKRIAIEVRDHKKPPKPVDKMILDLQKTIDNRNADYVIYLAKNPKSLPREVGWFHEYDDNILFCALGLNDTLHDEFLRISYTWAKMKVLINGSNDEDEINVTFLQGKLKKMTDKLRKLATIETYCGNIDKQSELIKEASQDLKEDIQELIEMMESEIRQKPLVSITH